MDDALRLLQTFLSAVPYADHIKDSEGHYQQMLYVIFSLFGMYVDVRTPVGRVDMVMRTTTTLYVVELKLNQSAEAAMHQIDLKQYPERFRLTGLPIVKVGINFDSEHPAGLDDRGGSITRFSRLTVSFELARWIP